MTLSLENRCLVLLQAVDARAAAKYGASIVDRMFRKFAVGQDSLASQKLGVVLLAV
jgi:hypothetical protein